MITIGTWKYEKERHADIIDGVSMTIPDEAYTIQELFQRSAAGLGLNIRSNYLQEGTENAQFDDIDMEQLSKMDIHDAQEVVKNVQEKFDKAMERQEFLKNNPDQDPDQDPDANPDPDPEFENKEDTLKKGQEKTKNGDKGANQKSE